jgi:hypothetical protein
MTASCALVRRAAGKGTQGAIPGVMRFSSLLRSGALAGAVVLAGLGGGAATAATPAAPARVTSPDGRDFAEVRPRATGGDALWVCGTRKWPKDPAHGGVVIAAPRWSRSGEALAMLVRQEMTTRLVVVLVRGEAAGEVLEWTVPPEALPAKVVTWLDAHRVSVGAREMEPKMVAMWKANAE